MQISFKNCPKRVVFPRVAHTTISDHSLVYVFCQLSKRVTLQ